MVQGGGFASIHWRDAGRHAEACEQMKLTAPDLLALGIVDEVIPEPEGGGRAHFPEFLIAPRHQASAALLQKRRQVAA